jgi:hypothetical protein
MTRETDMAFTLVFAGMLASGGSRAGQSSRIGGGNNFAMIRAPEGALA